MYGFPDDFDPNVFLGGELESVHYTENTAVLNFSTVVTVTFMCPIRYCLSDEVVKIDEHPIQRSELMGLVGKSVTRANLISAKELTLTFGEHGSISIIDEYSNYESLSISVADNDEIYV